MNERETTIRIKALIERVTRLEAELAKERHARKLLEFELKRLLETITNRRVLLRVSATPEELKEIQALSTRRRTELLLACVELKKVADVEGWEMIEKETWEAASDFLYRFYGKADDEQDTTLGED